jgi:formiminotetrahydrofolate cyclodeaminase
MKLIDLSVNDFIQEVDSCSPAPGGGSVSALASTLGASLLRMVGHLTISKKKFLALPAETQTEFKLALEQLLLIKVQLTDLIDADTASFNQIMCAYQLPKEKPEELVIRNQKIQEATLGAIQVPLAVANLSLKALQSIAPLLKNGNKNALSDLGVGALMLFSGLEGAILNVEINLGGLDDRTIAESCQQMGARLITDGRAVQDQIVSEIHQRLRENRA